MLLLMMILFTMSRSALVIIIFWSCSVLYTFDLSPERWARKADDDANPMRWK